MVTSRMRKWRSLCSVNPAEGVDSKTFEPPPFSPRGTGLSFPPQWLFAILLLFWAPCSVGNTIIIDIAQKSQNLTNQIDILIDANDSPDTLQFQATQSINTNCTQYIKGISSKETWLHMVLANYSEFSIQRWLVFGNAELLEISVYQRVIEEWPTLPIGNLIPLKNASDPSQKPVYKLLFAAGEKVELYVRLGPYSSWSNGVALWDPTHYMQRQIIRNFRSDTALLILLLTSAFCIFVYRLFKSKIYLWLAVSVACAALSNSILDGWLQAYLWPVAESASSMLHLLLSLLSLFAMHQLLKSESISSELSSSICNITMIFAALVYVGMVFSFTSHSAGIILLSACELIIISAFFITCIFAWHAGNVSARNVLLFLVLYWICEWMQQLAALGYVSIADTGNDVRLLSPILALPFVFFLLTKTTRTYGHQLKQIAQVERQRFERLSRVGHELKTPLTNVIGFAKLLKSKNSTISTLESAQEIERSCNYLHGLIESMLMHSVTASGHGKFKQLPLELEEWMRETMNSCKLTCHLSGNRFSFKIAGNLPRYIFVDELKLRQVVKNLLSNANHFTQNGLIEIAVRAHKGYRHCTLYFEVADTGIGIASEDQARIFFPFVQLDANSPHGHHRKGLGLGLPIVKELVQQMGGDISVRSQISQGTRFIFHIKCKTLPESEFMNASLSQGEASGTSERLAPAGTARWRALVVDMDIDTASSLAQQLSSVGVWTDMVVHEGAAISTLVQSIQHSSPYHLIIAGPTLSDAAASHLFWGSRLVALDVPIARVHKNNGVRASTEDTPFDIHVLAEMTDVDRKSISSQLTTRSHPQSATALVASRAAPPVQALEELRHFARNGQFSEIEVWVNHVTAGEDRLMAFGSIVLEFNTMLDYVGLDRWVVSLITRIGE